ncbi:TVP38/TMEM64 family protein [Filobacillus milosensis]|uniref:TVP38/TMEM64 family membrane protein n=1 Tax=Filobacillus milosensis TaxID=94137 RepID=A0A4Y8IN07_9BACI|nr:TVP38/TMEM64 family protein [Filobacillus milosensis]TFB21772.1 TVP38/TMEM64 family protein [Filobacillus milosensis]
MNKDLKKFIFKNLIIVSIVAILFIINKLFFNIKASDLEDWVNGFGVWAPIIILLVFSIRPFTLVPLSIIAITTGLLFGAYMGTLYIVIGTVLGASTSFIALRYFREQASIDENENKNLYELKNDLEKNGFKSVLMIRLIPAMNFDLITYLCSKTHVSFWKFVGATSIGTIPGSFMFGFFGSSLLKLKPLNIGILLGIIIVIIVLGYVLKRQLDQKYDMDELKEELKSL